VAGQEILIDVRTGIQQGRNRDDKNFRLDVAEPLFMRELFREFPASVREG
jgi:hypothetical protein